MLEINRIHQVDCTKGMSLIDPETLDVVVTSSPYNIGVAYKIYKDTHPREEYLNWMEEVATKIKCVLKEDSSLFLNLGTKLTDPWIAMDVATRFRNHFILQNTIYWIKGITIDKNLVRNYPGITQDVAIGHYKPIRGLVSSMIVLNPYSTSLRQGMSCWIA